LGTRCTNWSSEEDLLKARSSGTLMQKVTNVMNRLVHLIAVSSFKKGMMIAPTSGKKMMMDRIDSGIYIPLPNK
jgi:hypothetical protein